MVEKIRPLYDRLFVERIEADEKTEGGLYIPEGAKEKGQTGKVLAAGAGRLDPQGKNVPLSVKVGDTIYFGKYAGTDLDDKHLILKEDDILGVVESK
jgi:chaperonin GroES